MIKAIVFDFDGVILESAHIKTDAFRDVFSKWPEIVDQAVDYHLRNSGVTRYKKFEYVYNELLNQTYSDSIGQELSDEFSASCFEKIKAAPLVEGVCEFLRDNNQKFDMFVASASPDEELKQTIEVKQLSKYFKGVFGHPKLKKDTILDVLKKYQLEKSEVVFVGDGESDLKAARDTGIQFILRKTKENDYLVEGRKYIVDNFTQLNVLLGKIG